MHVEVGGKECLLGPGGNIECDELYGYLGGVQFASTSQSTPEVYRVHFTAILMRLFAEWFVFSENHRRNCLLDPQ